jgi:hypothetical protein
VSSSVPWGPNVDALPGRIHGGVHMRNCGVSSSIQSRCKAVGAELHSSLVKRQLKNIQDRNDYHMTRKNKGVFNFDNKNENGLVFGLSPDALADGAFGRIAH